MSQLPLPPASRQLGQSDISIAPLAWGMWRLSGSVTEAAALCHTAIDAGLTFFDTADIYGFDGNAGFGDAEALLGAVFASDPAVRRAIVLASKGGIMPPIPYDQSATYLTAAIDASLRRLRVETIDLYQIHRPDILTHPQEVARTLEEAVRAGKIRSIGVSNMTMHQIAALQHFLGQPIVSTQPEISPLRISCFENGELDQAMMMGMTPMAWSPLGGGRLADPQDERARAVAVALDVVAGEAGVSRTVAAYSWLMAHPAGIVPIVGTQTAARVTEAATARHVQWTREQWYAVFAAARGEKLP